MPNVLGKILYNSEYILTSTTEAQPQRNTKIYVENLFSLKRKITGQTSNNFTILNRDYNIQRYNLSTKKKPSLFLFSHCSLLHYVSLTNFSCSLYVSLLLCLFSLTQFFKTAPVLTLRDFSSLFYTKQPNDLIYLLLSFSSFILNL